MNGATTVYTPYCIPLNKSILIFFPLCPSLGHSRREPDATQDTSLLTLDNTENYDSKCEACVVQVTIKQANDNVIKEMSTFFLAQYDITKAVESALYAHIFAILPREICIEGDGYILRGKRKPWAYGQTLKLRWGEENIRPCQDKWMFIFELVVPQPVKPDIYAS